MIASVKAKKASSSNAAKTNVVKHPQTIEEKSLTGQRAFRSPVVLQETADDFFEGIV